MFLFDDVIVILVLTDIRVKIIIYIGTELIVENYSKIVCTPYMWYRFLVDKKCIYKYIYTSSYDENGLLTLHGF